MTNYKYLLNRAKHAPILILLLIMTGCAGRSPISQLNPGDELTIRPVENETSHDKISVSNEELGQTTLEMGGGGALAGAAMGFSCGPYFFFCAPLGFFAGGTLGTTAGFFIGAMADLDKETKIAISEKFVAAVKEENINNRLVEHLQNRSARSFIVTTSENANHLSVNISKIQMQSYDEGIALFIRADAELKFRDESDAWKKKADTFEYVSPPMPVNSWVMAEELFYQQLFASAYYYLSEEIIVNLIKPQKESKTKVAQNQPI